MEHRKPRIYKYRKISLSNIEEIEKIFDTIFESTKYCELTKTIIFPDGDDKDEIKINLRKMSFDKEGGEKTKDFNRKIYDLPDIRRRLTRSINFNYNNQGHSQKIEMEMTNGVGLTDYGSIYLSIASDNEEFLYHQFQKLDGIIKSFEAIDHQKLTKIFRNYDTILLFALSILIWVMLSIGFLKIVLTTGMSKALEQEIIIPIIGVSLFFSIGVVNFLQRKVEKAIPNVDFDFGPKNSRENIAAKKTIVWFLTIFAGCVASIISTYLF